MRYLLMFAIRIYWRIPTKLHDKCIFKETCSHYVYRIAEHQGVIPALKAFKERNRQCRPGYVIYRSKGKFYLKTAEGDVFEEDQISPRLLPPNKTSFLDFDAMGQYYRPSDK
jgi:putative component of membrane protein insertase Oxa1/YidC/SpoIIIJ protein YidD